MLYRKITLGQHHDIWKHMNILDLPEDVHDHIGFVLGGDCNCGAAFLSRFGCFEPRKAARLLVHAAYPARL